MVLRRLRYKPSLRDLAEKFLARNFAFNHEAVRDWEARLAPLLTTRLCAKGADRVARSGTRTRTVSGRTPPSATFTGRSTETAT